MPVYFLTIVVNSRIWFGEEEEVRRNWEEQENGKAQSENIVQKVSIFNKRKRKRQKLWAK